MTNSRRTVAGWIVLAVIAAGLIFLWTGNRGYGKVSRETWEVARAVYGACLAKDERRLDAVEEKLAPDDGGPDGISPKELRWLNAIIKKARAGKWEAASRAARRIMEDQVEY